MQQIMSEWLPIVQVLLNALLLPLLLILNDIRIELAKLGVLIASHAVRIDRIESRQDRRADDK